MAEVGRCDFACANSINTGQIQLVNQPSPSVKQFCCSERRWQVKNQVYASLSLRCTYLCLLSSERGEKREFLSSFDVTREETLKLIPCCSHYNRTDPAHFLWDSVQKTSGHRVLWQQTPWAAWGNRTLTWGPPAATKLLLTCDNNFIWNSFLKYVIALIFKSTTNKLFTHLSNA